MNIAISSGHGLHVAGARDIIDEVTEARLVTDRVAEYLKQGGAIVDVFHDDTSRNQRDNVNTIVRHHNAQDRGLDVSVHFNAVAGGTRQAGIGVETLYRKGNEQTREIASRVSQAISEASGLILRRGDGTLPANNKGFLNNTNRPAILLEICFVNSHTDVELYRTHFDAICKAIAETLLGRAIATQEPQFPISEHNIQRMIELGVMHSPDYWRGVNLRWLDQLLTNAGEAGKLDNRINNGITDIDTALEVLVYSGIITNYLFWATQTLLHLDQLLINIANISRNPLERIIHAEAQGEGLKGQILVGNVILNRCASPNFPNGIHPVIFQSGINSQGELVHQFKPVVNGAYSAAIPSAQVKQAVDKILNGVDHSEGATHFHAIIGGGKWHKQALAEGRLVKLFDYEGHRFYKEK